MTDELLLDKLRSFFVLKERIKENRNFIKEIRLAFKISKSKNEIISLIDNSVLNFKELYNLLKLYEEKKKQIQFETQCIVYVEEDFEDTIFVPCIFIKKLGYNFNKELKCIVIDSHYKDIDVTNKKGTRKISPFSINNPDVSLFFERFKYYFKKDYESFADLVISYLIYKYL